jgi:hypothetical protein
MTVAKLIEKLESIQQTWKTKVVQQRPGEEPNLKQHLGNAVSYPSISASFDSWLVSLKKLADKPKISKQISKPLLESADVALSSISAALAHVGNGVDWMCTNRSFCSGYTIAGALIREICSEHGREAEVIVNAANERLSKDINSIQLAVSQSETFVSNWKDLQAKIETIEAAKYSVSETLKIIEDTTTTAKNQISSLQNELSTSAEESKEEITTALASFKETLDSALTSLEEAQKLHVEAQKIRGETQSTAAKAKSDLEASALSLTQAIEQEEKTKARLTEALKNAQMEGLAGSFTRMKEDTGAAITKEQTRFEVALGYLVAIGVVSVFIEAYAGFPKLTPEDFTIRMLRTLSLAAPGIWVAWVASRKLGALNRVFSDYQYKSASALAYESYRQTVAEAGSNELKQQLLAFAIHSFGENPTRYYDTAKNEASSPLESFLEKLPFFGKSKSSTGG